MAVIETNRSRDFRHLASLWRRQAPQFEGRAPSCPSANFDCCSLETFWPSPIDAKDDSDVRKEGKSVPIDINDINLSAAIFPLNTAIDDAEGRLRAEFSAVWCALDKAFRDFSLTPEFLDFHLRNPPGAGWPPVPSYVHFLQSLKPTDRHAEDEAYLQNWARMVYDSLPWLHEGSNRFETFVGFWLKRLLGITSLTPNYEIDFSSWWPEKSGTPVGFLANDTPEDFGWAEQPERLPDGFENGFVYGGPAKFSSGFHQVLPLIIQFAAMRMGELCAVENPEVHLHPGLQLKLTEFFIENAKIGKFALLETHSDLVIRRTLRAIGAEDIRQSWVGVWFVGQEESTKRKSGEDVPASASIECLKLNARGQVSNWPEGFLEDDVKESEALMAQMYGRNGTVEETHIGDETGR